MGSKKDWIHSVHSLDHVMLPWDSSGYRVVVIVQLLPQLFPVFVSLLPWMCCSSCSQVMPLRHLPGITLFWSSSRSIAAFCSA